jgi:hypothetical protein
MPGRPGKLIRDLLRVLVGVRSWLLRVGHEYPPRGDSMPDRSESRWIVRL